MKNKAKVEELDKSLTALQHSSAEAGVSLGGSTPISGAVEAVDGGQGKEGVGQQQMDLLVDSMASSKA